MGVVRSYSVYWEKVWTRISQASSLEALIVRRHHYCACYHGLPYKVENGYLAEYRYHQRAELIRTISFWHRVKWVQSLTRWTMTTKKTRIKHSPEFKAEALKLAEKVGVAAAARQLSLHESQIGCKERHHDQSARTRASRWSSQAQKAIGRGLLQKIVGSELRPFAFHF